MEAKKGKCNTGVDLDSRERKLIKARKFHRGMGKHAEAQKCSDDIWGIYNERYEHKKICGQCVEAERS